MEAVGAALVGALIGGLFAMLGSYLAQKKAAESAAELAREQAEREHAQWLRTEVYRVATEFLRDAQLVFRGRVSGKADDPDVFSEWWGHYERCSLAATELRVLAPDIGPEVRGLMGFFDRLTERLEALAGDGYATAHPDDQVEMMDPLKRVYSDRYDAVVVKVRDHLGVVKGEPVA